MTVGYALFERCPDRQAPCELVAHRNVREAAAAVSHNDQPRAGGITRPAAPPADEIVGIRQQSSLLDHWHLPDDGRIASGFPEIGTQRGSSGGRARSTRQRGADRQ